MVTNVLKKNAHRSTIRVAIGANYMIWLTKRYVVAMIVANPTLAQSLASPLLSSPVSRYSSPFPVIMGGVVASGTDATNSSPPPWRRGRSSRRSYMSKRRPRKTSRPCNQEKSRRATTLRAQFWNNFEITFYIHRDPQIDELRGQPSDILSKLEVMKKT